jgi:hypothetical protein
VPNIKLDILEVKGFKEYADRSVDIAVVDRVRGPVVLRMQEDTARWLFAIGMDQMTKWRSQDDEKEMGE